MFTGIVEAVGRVRAVEERDRGRRLTIEAPELAPELEPGASISVDGACLTVVEPGPETFAADVIGTTLSRTVAGTYREGSPVNLERALALGDRLEGHLVQGHVDGVGRVLETREEGTHLLLDVELPPDVWDATVLHGSITLNGVSLTVNALEPPDRCQVALIPHTRENTNLSALEAADLVNVEGDLIGKYVGKIVRSRGREEASGPLDPGDGRASPSDESADR